jgi:hypothetical protein
MQIIRSATRGDMPPSTAMLETDNLSAAAENADRFSYSGVHRREKCFVVCRGVALLRPANVLGEYQPFA